MYNLHQSIPVSRTLERTFVKKKYNMLMFTAFLLEGCRIGSVSQTDLATEYFSQNRIIWACAHLDNDIITEFSVHIYI